MLTPRDGLDPAPSAFRKSSATEQPGTRVPPDAVASLLSFTGGLPQLRVASLQMTMFQSHLNMNALTGQATDLHEISHNGVSGGTMAVSKAIAWHVKWFAYLLQKERR